MNQKLMVTYVAYTGATNKCNEMKFPSIAISTHIVL